MGKGKAKNFVSITICYVFIHKMQSMVAFAYHNLT
jgi:hypothetical protein